MEQPDVNAQIDADLSAELMPKIPAGKAPLTPRPYIPTLSELRAASYPPDVAAAIIDRCQEELADWLQANPEPESKLAADLVETSSQLHFACPECKAKHSIDKAGLMSQVIGCGCGAMVLLR